MAQGNNARSKGSADLAEARRTPAERLDATSVEIDGETFWIGKIVLSQLSALARVVAAAASRLDAQQRKELADAAGSDRANIEAAVALLDEDTVSRVFGIMLDRDTDWVRSHVGALDALRVLDAVCERNDWRELQAAFFRLARRFKSSAEAA